jgi:SAM-dependent methyltransferase
MQGINLRAFYQSPLGETTRQLLAARLGPLLPRARDAVVLGLGHAEPYLTSAACGEAITLALAPARLGASPWPEGEANRSALVDELDLPLGESVVDVVLVVHGLEISDSPEDMLHEVWRVLAPQGRLVLVAPNRSGMWSSRDASPFGHGQPFSRPQVSRLLNEAQFSITRFDHALFLPPSAHGLMQRLAPAVEWLGGVLWPSASGVTVVEAVKQVYAFAPARRKRRFMPQLPPVLSPQPVRREPS